MEHTATCASKHRVGRFVVLIADFCNKICQLQTFRAPFESSQCIPTNQSSRHFEPMRQPSEGSVVLYRPCLIRETQLELERRSCQSCSEVRRKLMRSMSSRY